MVREDRGGVAEADATGCPWRYPGQYEDPETGLYYNRFRYYDPETGIYITKDPIGLAGGLAQYAYVRDPETWIDPLGEDGHHTMPKGLLEEMATAGILDETKLEASKLKKYGGDELAQLGSPHHINAHKALTSFLEGKYPGLQFTNGYQVKKQWKDYVKGKSLNTILGDFGQFYNKWLPKNFKQFGLRASDVVELQRSFTAQRPKIAGCK